MQQLKKFFLPTYSVFFVSSFVLMLNSCNDTSTIQWNGSSPASCVGIQCVTVGAYNLDGTANLAEDTSNSRQAFTAYSKNIGQTFFSSPQIVMPSDNVSTNSSQLTSVSCVGLRCIATGAYNLALDLSMGTYAHSTPLIAISQDGGETFTHTTSVVLPVLNPNTLSFISGITCTGPDCVGVGIYNFSLLTGGTPSPLIVISQNGGRTFVATEPSLPLDHSTPVAARLNAVSCMGNTCVAVGQYTNNVTSVLPLVLFSNDKGRTFTKAFSPALPDNPMSATPSDAQLYGVTCNNKNRCIGVGAYNTSDGTFAAFIILSDDGGQTFTKAVSPNLPSDAVSGRSAVLKGISCNDHSCTAVGTYNLDGALGAGQPLVLVSNNSGDTFSPVAQQPLPLGGVAPALTEQLTGVVCTDFSCVGVGGYNMEIQNTNPKFGKPLTVWKKIYHDAFSSASVPALPKGADPTLGAGFGYLNIP